MPTVYSGWYNMKKTISIVLVLTIILSSIFVMATTSGESISKPSAPQFTLKYVDNSYDVPPASSSTTDPYTGKTVTTTTPGYRVEEKSIQITVTNQPFTPYTDANGKAINLFYNVRYRGHYGDESNWITPFYKTIRNGEYGFTQKNPQTDSQYTVITVPSEFKEGDVVDFQVQTMEGYHTSWEPILVAVMGTSQFTGISSDWSSTQTITIGKAQTSTITPTPMSPSSTDSLPNFGPTSSPTPNNGELAITLAFIATTVAILCVIVLVLYVRHLKKKLKNQG
jgi:hypothetical protein